MKRQRGRGRRSGGGNNSNPNKHFESNGPDVKIRGSAQQILDKYQQLGRDAQTSGDRVNAENYLQHAEHYYRVLATMQPKDKPREPQADGQAGETGEASENGAQSQADGEPRDEGREQNRSRGRNRNRRDREDRTSTETGGSSEGEPALEPEAVRDAVVVAPDADLAGEDAPVAAEKPKRRRVYKKREPAPASADDGEDGVMKTLSRGRKKAASTEPEAAADKSAPVPDAAPAEPAD